MKVKTFTYLCALALVSVLFSSCKKKTDVDAIFNDLTNDFLSGYFSGTETDGSTMNVAQYCFNADGTVTFTTMQFGDGIYTAPVSTQYASYRLGDYNTQGLGRYVHLYPQDGGETLTVNYIRAGIESGDHPFMSGKNDKVKEIPALADSLKSRVWYANDTTFYRIDTTVMILKLDTFKHRVRDGRTYKWVIDSVVAKNVPTKVKWPVGPSAIRIKQFELYRDETTLANTGKWYSLTKNYVYNAARVGTNVLDSVSTYNFRWYIASYANANSFTIHVIPDSGDDEEFVLKYDSKIPAVTIDKQVLRIQKEEEDE